jgi:hypothetical protein
MLHSKTIIQSMIARRSDEEPQDTKSAEPQRASRTPSTREYSQRETDFMRACGHHNLADELEGKTGTQSSQPQEVAPMLEPYMDHAAPILIAHGIAPDLAAEVWDRYHSARDSKVLIEKLQPLDIPNATKHELVLEKQKGDPAPDWFSRLNQAVEAVKRVAALPREQVETSERHPRVFQALLDAQKNDK